MDFDGLKRFRREERVIFDIKEKNLVLKALEVPFRASLLKPKPAQLILALLFCIRFTKFPRNFVLNLPFQAWIFLAQLCHNLSAFESPNSHEISIRTSLLNPKPFEFPNYSTSILIQTNVNCTSRKRYNYKINPNTQNSIVPH